MGATDGMAQWDVIRAALGSVADTAIIPMQDLFGLGSDARMNVPGQADGNWSWRYGPGLLDRGTRDRLAELTALCGRWNGSIPERFQPPRPPEVEPARAASEQPPRARPSGTTARR